MDIVTLQEDVVEDIEDKSCSVAPVVEPTDPLHVPYRRRLSSAYVTSDSGVRELCIYYGTKEVVFDEDRLFAFGEQLVRQTSFIAQAALSWGPGYEWPEIRTLLEGLVAEGILQRGEVSDDARGTGLVPSRVPSSVCPVARSWSAGTCESITRDLAGRAVEIGHLEAILSVYRIAHPALDADDRQVGEANVFPPGLRLDRETEWRVCQYAGSRYRDDAPMNVTALKAMIKYWKPMMMTILAVRAELKQRLARSRDGWTVGDLHLFAGVALSLPAFQLLAAGGSSPQRPLDPVLASLFRIADGIRMATHLMLFLSDDRTRSPEEPTTATDLYDFAERNGSFLSRHGVCAGPKALIDEFLDVVFDGTLMRGREAVELPAQVQDLVSRLPAAVDYALLGLQAWAVSRSVWLAMSRAYCALHELLEASAGDAGTAGRLRERVRADWKRLDDGRIASEYERAVHATVYTDTYEQAWRALRCPVGAPALAECIAPCPEDPTYVTVARRLRAVLSARLSGTALAGAASIDAIVAILVRYLREERSILRSIEQLQAAINALLDRPRPRGLLTARDLRVTFAMNGGAIAEFPYLFDMLDDELDVRVECTADAVAIIDPRAGGSEPDLQLCAGNSAGAQ